MLKEVDLVCAAQKIYVATSKYLPDKFKDGTYFTGPKTCRTQIHKHSNNSVSITSCRTNTTIYIRRVGKYLTFNIKSPYEILNKSSGLCYSGCPRSELVDYTSFFENRIQKSNQVRSRSSLPTNAEAMHLCSQSNLTDFYYDSCVFDLLTTGDRQFSEAARSAMLDAQNMDPKLRLRRENSVVLRVVKQASMSSSSAAWTLNNNSKASIYLLSFILLFLLCIVR